MYDVYVCVREKWWLVSSMCVCVFVVCGLFGIRSESDPIGSDSERWQLLVFVFTHSLPLVLSTATTVLYDSFHRVLDRCRVPPTASNLFHLFSFSLPAKNVCMCVFICVNLLRLYEWMGVCEKEYGIGKGLC